MTASVIKVINERMPLHASTAASFFGSYAAEGQSLRTKRFLVRTKSELRDALCAVETDFSTTGAIGASSPARWVKL